jgi:hypothetical protein
MSQLTRSDISFKENINKQSSISKTVNTESIFKMFVSDMENINTKNEVINIYTVRLDTFI